MYEYHYNVFKEIYNDKIVLCYCDTDSFVYQIYTDDLFTDLVKYEIHDLLDFSNYPENHFLKSNNRKKALGFIKDECASVPIIEFVGLKPKLYSILTKNETKKTCKGIQKAILKKFVTHEHYRSCLNNTIYFADNTRLQAKNQEISTIKVNKLAYSPFDDKRLIKNDTISTTAFGNVSWSDN